MAVRIKDFFRNLTSGAGISGRTVLLKKHSDDTQIASTTTAADGSFSFSDSDFTYRGPTYYEVDDGTRFKEHSSKSLGQVGPVWFTDIIRAFDGMGPGVINGLAVSAGLGNMNLSIAAGSAILKDGILHGDDSARTLTVTTADATNPRIDTVVLRVTRIGIEFDIPALCLPIELDHAVIEVWPCSRIPDAEVHRVGAPHHPPQVEVEALLRALAGGHGRERHRADHHHPRRRRGLPRRPPHPQPLRR